MILEKRLELALAFKESNEAALLVFERYIQTTKPDGYVLDGKRKLSWPDIVEEVKAQTPFGKAYFGALKRTCERALP